MKLSIITPHYQNFEGLKTIYDCLIKQSSNQWEWLIVDDFSDPDLQVSIQGFFESVSLQNIHIVFNTIKTNASVCRNIGIDRATHTNLVFLDSDDTISEHFVANRLIEVEEFNVFPHYFIQNEKGSIFSSQTVASNYLDYFLKAQFIWQTTCVLWNKGFLIDLGKFNANLQRLQDVELAIRSLYHGKHFKVLDNVPDFYYHVKPIRTRTHFLKTVCVSVQYIITELDSNYQFKEYQKKLLKGYYYLCVKYLHRSGNRTEVNFVKDSLKQFYKKNYIHSFDYIKGSALLFLFKYRLLSDVLFIKFNRYFFKP